MSQAREIHKPPPPHLWVVWAEGRYRIHWSAKHASNCFDRFAKAGKTVQLIRYDSGGLDGEFKAPEEQNEPAITG